ncbi:MAG: CpaE family protein [Actinomycetota bacterium]
MIRVGFVAVDRKQIDEGALGVLGGGDEVVDVLWSDDLSADLEPTAAVEALAKEAVDVVVVGDGPDEAWVLELSRVMAATRGDIGVVLLRKPSPELWSAAARAGGREVVDPFDASTTLVPAVEAALARGRWFRASLPQETAVAEVPGGARILAVLAAKGGSGKTFVAVNLAVTLAKLPDTSVVVVDFDRMFGDVATLFGVEPEYSLLDLVRMTDFDATSVKVNLTVHPSSGVYLLCANAPPEEAEAIPATMAAKLLGILAHEFDYVVVDTAAGLDEWATVALDHATDLVYVAAMDVTSIRNLALEIEVVNRIGVGNTPAHLVVNRADPQTGISVEDVEKALGLPAELVIPWSMDAVLTSNVGEPITVSRSRSPITRGFAGFAGRLTGTEDPAPTSGRRRWWRGGS